MYFFFWRGGGGIKLLSSGSYEVGGDVSSSPLNVSRC